MSPIQKGLIWIAAILVAIFALSIGLSWYTFGYLDSKTVGSMALLLLPILGSACVAFVWTANVETSKAAPHAANPAENQGNPEINHKPAPSGI